MASSSKRKGSVKAVERWKHLKHRKRDQNKLVRRDSISQCGWSQCDLEDQDEYKQNKEEWEDGINNGGNETED